jgi:glycosyltransferase involved in cell wall biosynthesis
MKTSMKPRVSLGLPVFNGDNYIEETLDSILAQTYTDFEVIISDNASTDRTQEICQKYATKDPRIRYYRNETDLGAARNYNRTFELSSGEYFKWTAHDDLLGPEFLERCVAVLDQDSSIVLCYSRTGKIDGYGRLTGNFDRWMRRMRVDARWPHIRFHDLITVVSASVTVWGVARASALNKTPLIGNYIGSDRNLVAELALMGRFYEIPEQLYFQRFHPRSFSVSKRDNNSQLAWFDPRTAEQVICPGWVRFHEHVMSVRRVPLSQSDQLLCYAQLLAPYWAARLKFAFIGKFRFLLKTTIVRKILKLDTIASKS